VTTSDRRAGATSGGKSDATYRDQEWLENLLAQIWYEHFIDIEQTNQVQIRWGRRAKRRLGSISLDPTDRDTSIITVNRIFTDLAIPEFVIKATIVHEMTHYAHGFNSPLDQQHKYPHSGGVIRQEFAERDLEDLYLLQKKWLKANWPGVIARYWPAAGQRRSAVRVRRAPAKNAKNQLPRWLRNI